MLNKSLSSFQNSLRIIRDYYSDLNEKNSVLDDTYGELGVPSALKSRIGALQAKRTAEKQFDYTVLIISLYGQYESFVEKLIKEFLEELHLGNYRFSQLPQEIRESYFAKGIKLHSKLTWEKFSRITKEMLAKSLSDSYNNDSQNILPEAFFTDNGNYKMDVLAACLSELGVSNIKQHLCNYPALKSYYLQKHGNVNINGIDDSLLYGLIDEVVETRNRLAHTGTVDNIKDKSYIEDMFAFFEAFAESLNMLIQDTLCSLAWDISAVQPLAPSNVFKHNNVIGFKGVKVVFHLDQEYLYKSPPGVYPRFVRANVESITCGHVFYKNFYLSELDPTGVGIKVGHTATLGGRFKFL